MHHQANLIPNTSFWYNLINNFQSIKKNNNVGQAAQAKKAIFCEKPIALDEESIKKCFKAAEENNVPLLCGK